MYFGIQFILYITGYAIISLVVFVPSEMQFVIPFWFRFVAWFMATFLGFVGIVIVYGRARSTGANQLIAPARPGTVKWFYFYRDGEMRILPSKRAGEGQLYCDELDAQVPDVKTYSLCDHKIRIVPELVGHAVDLDYVMYADLLKTKWGFENLRQARAGWINEKLHRTKEIIDNEYLVVGDQPVEGGEPNVSLNEKIKKLSKRPNTTTQ